MDNSGDFYDKAAALLIVLVQSLPFDSGNRRTASAASMAFLRINGEYPRIVHDTRVLQEVREGFYAKDEIKNWLKGHEIWAFHR